MIGRTVSHYEIVERIGDGGMGRVYKARDTRLNVSRALKFIHAELVPDDELKSRFIREAQAASSLDHPNICAIHEVDETDSGRPFICMTYYEGESLSERLGNAPLPLVEILQVGYAAALGLACAHRNGIYHRDIKPGNILITTEGKLKIVDFGLAKLVGRTELTIGPRHLGTVRYMSPEQVNGGEIDQRTDIWALGVVLFEMATGRLPFRADRDAAVLYQILHQEIPPPRKLNPDLPKELASLLERCLAKDPAQRHQSVEELLADLIAIARKTGLGGVVFAMTADVVDKRAVIVRHRIRTALITAAIVVLGLGARWWLDRPPPLFTTELRIAVMPLDNMVHPSQTDFVGGLTGVVCEMLDECSRHHPSMWVVPDRLVTYAELADDAGAREAFGVNSIVTGDLQRHADGQAVLLALRDADTLERLDVVTIPFSIDAVAAMADSLPGAIARLVGLDADERPDLARFLPGTDPALTNYLAGIGALRDKSYATAIDLFEQAAVADSGFGGTPKLLGEALWGQYRITGDETLLARAVRNLEKASAATRECWRPRYHLGEIQRRSGNIETALSAFEAATAIDPGNPRVCRGLSRIYRSQNRIDEAEHVLQTAIEERPDYFEVHRLLATFYFRTGEVEAALQKLQDVLLFAPGDAYTHNWVGKILHDQGDFAGAREHFERAFRLLPDCDSCSNVALMLYFEERFGESASYYEYATEYCDSTNYGIWANWATSLYWAEGRREESVVKFRTAIGLATEELRELPGDPELIGDLLGYWAMIGDEETTRRLIVEYESIAAGNAELLYQIGNACEILGDRNGALRYLANAVRHGFSIERIRGTHELEDLIGDPRFEQLAKDEERTTMTEG